MNGSDIYYVNADDSYRGLVTKLEICEEAGVQMIAPGENGFEIKHLAEYMLLMVRDDTARGKVIILDTLKKVADLMDKKSSSEFMTTARLFAQNGGSMILLAHTNKKRDGDNKLIFAGTSDVVDDCDCAYVLDDDDSAEGLNGRKTVKFENIKARGDVLRKLSVQYQVAQGQSYRQLLDSVRVLDEAEAARQMAKYLEAEQWKDDQKAIAAIKDAIQQGHVVRSKLIKSVQDDSDIS
jgi:hypothetical protein